MTTDEVLDIRKARKADLARDPRWSTCPYCDTRWTALGACHCSGCHRTFAGSAAFDGHRRDGACIDPATIRHRKTGELRYRIDGGMWRSAKDRPGDLLMRLP